MVHTRTPSDSVAKYLSRMGVDLPARLTPTASPRQWDTSRNPFQTTSWTFRTFV
ncbi:Uncharacterised protein [Mycobacterium tuberculosis]|nr:Uncharacterised protein [Mycobacterium tuberculosis]